MWGRVTVRGESKFAQSKVGLKRCVKVHGERELWSGVLMGRKIKRGILLREKVLWCCG